MSNAYSEYRDRVQFKGSTKREYVKTKVRESIESLIADSQYGFTIRFEDQKQDIAILSTKTTQEYEAANIIAPLSVGIKKGSLFEWENGGEEDPDKWTNPDHWIVLKQMFRPDQPGFNGIAYRCNFTLKWIDKHTKRLKVAPAYVRSGRITNALGYTTDVYRFYDNLSIHTPDWNMIAAIQRDITIHPEDRFIINGSAYRTVSVDNVSIDGISIISLVDDKLLDSDKVEEGIAYNEDYEYRVEVATKEDLKIYVGDILDLPINVIKDGNPIEEDIILSIPENAPTDIVDINNGYIIGRKVGTTTVRVALERNESVYIDIPVETVEEMCPIPEEKVYIVGSDYLEWNNTETYKLSNGDVFDEAPSVEVKSKIRKTIKWAEDNSSVSISVKDKYSGTVVITGTYQGETLTKTIYIRTVSEGVE